jgi:hypothetical protein
MASTTFSAGTVVASTWLNDVNNLVYGTYKTLKQYSVPEDGVTDCTTLIQAALNSGYKRVVGTPGTTYIVSYAGSQTVGATAQRYCLNIPTGVVFDLNGATIKMAAASNASPIMLFGTTDSSVINGVIDSNKTNQTTPATGEIASIYAYNNTRLNINNIKAINNRMYAGRFLNNTGGYFTNLWATDSDGDGWNFGNSTYKNVECFIDNIYAEACTASYGGGFQGNGFILTGTNVNVGKVTTKSCAGGLKVQDDSSDINVNSLIFIGPTNGTANSGVKVQGNGAGLQPKRIKIGSVNVTNAYGNGLFISDVISAEVSQYHGYLNGTGAGATGSDKNDVDLSIPTLGRLYIGTVDSESPNGQNVRAQGAGYIRIDNINGKNPTGAGVSSSATEFECDSLNIQDTGATMTYAFLVTGGKGNVNKVTTNKTHSTTQSRVLVQTGLYDFYIGSIRLGSTDVVEPVVTLTNAATSTSVTDGHIWREYVGGTDYFQPVFYTVPVNSTAAALGQMRVVPIDGSTSTGYAIKHTVAGATDYVIPKVLHWTVISRATA